jgi:hypothetical protein
MAIRKCPACLTTAGMGVVASQTNDFVCAGCGQHLEVTEASRVLAATAGIAAGYFALSAVPSPHSTLGWAVPRLIPAPASQTAHPEPAAGGGHH